MLKKLVNQCTVDLELETREPLLVNSGDAVVGGPDMTFVRTRRQGKTEPFLPGSSLKGMLRAHAERIARTLKPESVCGVFESGDKEVEGCSPHFRDLDQEAEGNQAYSKESRYYEESCPACRLFGSTHWRGRFHIGDGYLTEEYRDTEPERRANVAIDRISGGVAEGPFDLEVMPTGVRFATKFDLTNFEVWQLGWMAYVLRDLTDGKLRMGMGTSRGLGRLKGHLQSVSLEYVGDPDGMEESVLGLGALSSKEERVAYGLAQDDRIEAPTSLAPERERGSLRAQAVLTDDEEQEEFFATVAPALNERLETIGDVPERRADR